MSSSAVNIETNKPWEKSARLKIRYLQQANKIEQPGSIFHHDTLRMSSKVKTKMRQHVWPLGGNTAPRSRLNACVAAGTEWLNTAFFSFFPPKGYEN